MARGRHRDLSIPATRSLVQQREYRARKAQYVAELEQRCFKAEAENEKLKKELDQIKSAQLFAQLLTPEAVSNFAAIMFLFRYVHI
jgi:hypothetical protein